MCTPLYTTFGGRLSCFFPEHNTGARISFSLELGDESTAAHRVQNIFLFLKPPVVSTMSSFCAYFLVACFFAKVCVFTAPLFSAFCALATYGFVKEVRDKGSGLVAAALVATVPSYISRSVAGSFDNEGVAIFALVFTFYLFVKVN